MEVVVNAAMSADGKLSSLARRQIPISGPADFDRVDRLRASVDAVLVGIGTILADDPRLTVKDADLRARRVEQERSSNPTRVVADSRARTPTDAAVLDDAAETILLVADRGESARGDELADHAELINAGENRVDLRDGFEALGACGIETVLVEGGGELIFSLFAAGLVDRLMTFIGPLVIGGRDAPTLADGAGFREGEFVDLALEDAERIDEGMLLSWAVCDGAEGSTSP